MTRTDNLRREWKEAVLNRPFHPYLHIDDEGLSLGAGTLLAPMKEDSFGAPVLALEGEEEQILALLSVAYGKSVRRAALKFIKRASMQWAKGERVMAHFELAYAQLPRFESKEDARGLFYADALVKYGASPRALMLAQGIDTREVDLVKYNADEPRVPAGSGAASGEWTSGEGGTAQNVASAGSSSEDVSDVLPDPIRPGQRYAQEEGPHRPGETRLLTPWDAGGGSSGGSVFGGGGESGATTESADVSQPNVTSPRVGGRLGGAATRELNSNIAGSLESQGYTITGGGGRLPEEYIPGTGPGSKGGTYVDITATDGTTTIRVQTIDAYADGTPIAREAAAAQRIWSAFPNDELRLIPKR